MNSIQAKKISIVGYLKTCGIEPEKIISGKAFYLSPLRAEKEPSFKVDINKNIWVDYGSGTGGNILDLCMQMNNTNVRGALQILSKMDRISFFSHKQEPVNTENESIQIKHILPIQNHALIQYLESRSICLEIAKKYVSECYFDSNNKKYFALCFANDLGGFELRNKYFKGSASPKYYTTIAGKHENQLNVFEGFMDFLSALSYYRTDKPNNKTIVLNSLSNIEKISGLLPSYNSINLYMDNDNAGNKASQDIITSFSNAKNQSEKLFPRCKDFNEFLCST